MTVPTPHPFSLNQHGNDDSNMQDDQPTDYSSLTKRKALDAISALDEATRPTTLSTLNGVTSSSGKKRRVSSSHESTPALQSLLLPSHLPKPPTTPPTSYAPLSLPALLSRIATFTLTTYSAKPNVLSPLECAMKGWINKAPPRERLECVSCSSGLLVLPPSSTSSTLSRPSSTPEPSKPQPQTNEGWYSPTGERLSQSYKTALESKHSPSCPWKLKGCDPSLYKLSIPGRKRLIEELRSTCESLYGVEGMHVGLPEEDEMDESIKLKLVHLFDGVSATAVLLALFEWKPHSPPSSSSSSKGETPEILSCQYCSRQILVSSFTTSASASNGQEGSREGENKRFDLVKQHTSWCAVVHGDGGSGWKKRVETLLGTASTLRSSGRGSEVGTEPGGSRIASGEALDLVRDALGSKKRKSLSPMKIG